MCLNTKFIQPRINNVKYLINEQKQLFKQVGPSLLFYNLSRLNKTVLLFFLDTAVGEQLTKMSLTFT